MDLAAIERMISRGESEVLEFKKSTSLLKAAAETLCAFLNARGGTVIIGVSPSGKIIGQHVSDATQQEMANTLRGIEPAVPIDVELVDLLSS